MCDLLDFQQKYVQPLQEYILSTGDFLGLTLTGPPQSGKTFLLKMLPPVLSGQAGVSCVYLDLELIAKELETTLKEVLSRQLATLANVSPDLLLYFGKPPKKTKTAAKTNLKRFVLLLDNFPALSEPLQENLCALLKPLRAQSGLTLIVTDLIAGFLPLKIDLGYLDPASLTNFWAAQHIPPDLMGEFAYIDPGKNHTPGGLLRFFQQYKLASQLCRLKRKQPALLKKTAILQYQWPEFFWRVNATLDQETNLLLALENAFTLPTAERQKCFTHSPALQELSRDEFLARLLSAPPLFGNSKTLRQYLPLFSGGTAPIAAETDDVLELWPGLISGDSFRLREIVPAFQKLDLDKQEDYLHRLLSIVIDVSLDEQMRAAASLALATVAPERSLRQLEYVLESTTNPNVRLWIAKTLGLIGLPRAREILQNMLKIEKMQVVTAGVEIFLDTQVTVLPLTNDLNRQEAATVRLAALNSLADLPLTEIRPLLETVLEKDFDPHLKARAAEILRFKKY